MGHHRRHRSSRPPQAQAPRSPQPLAPVRSNAAVAEEMEVSPTTASPMLDAAAGQAASAPPPAAAAPPSADGDPLEVYRARVLALQEQGAFAGGQGENNRGIRGSVAHGSNSSMLDGLEQSGGRVLSSADLAAENIERQSGEGSTFRGGSAAQSTVSVGVGESGFGAALAYGDASRTMNHYNPRRYTQAELDEEIETLEQIEGGYQTNRRGDILDADVSVNNHGRMQTYTQRLDILRAERTRREALPEGDPGREGGEANLQDHPIVFHMDSEGMVGETTSSNNVEGEVNSGFRMADHIQRAFVPLENVEETRTRLREITGRDVEVIPLEALDALPEGSNIQQARSNVLRELQRQDASHRGSRDVMAEWAAQGRTATTPEERQQMRVESHERREQYIEAAHNPSPPVPAWGEDVDEEEEHDEPAVVTRPTVRVGQPNVDEPVAIRRIIAVGEPEAEEDAVVTRPTVPVGDVQSDEPSVVVQRVIPVGQPAEEVQEVPVGPGGPNWHESVGRTGDGGASFDRDAQRTSVEAEASNARRTVGQETTTGVGAGVGTDGRLNGHIERGRTFQDHEADASERSSDGRTNRVGFEGRNVTARTTRSTVVHNDDGRTATERQVGARVGRNGVVVNGSTHRETDIADGSGDRRRVGATGSVDLTQRRATAGVNVSRRGADGQVQSGGSASGTLDLNDNGGLEEASASVTGTFRNVSLTADGRYRCSATDPTPVQEERRVGGVTRQHTTAWRVSWRRDVRVRLSGNAGEQRGGGAGFRYEEADSGVQSFPTLREARDFAENINQRVGDVAGTPEDSEAALGMGVGESVTEGSTVGGDANIHVAALDGFLNVGATAGHDTSEEREVTRGRDAEHGNYADVRVRAEDTSRLGVSLSSVGLGMGQNGEDSLQTESTIRFFLDTPEGRAAFDAYQNGRPLPATGWSQQSRTITSETTSTTSLDILTGDASTEDALREVVQEDADGNVSRNIRGRQTTQSNGIIDGENHNETEFRAGVPAEGSGQRYYRMAARAGGTDGDAIEDDLARATGVGSTNRRAEASGEWTVEQRMSASEVDQLAETLRSGQANTDALLAESGAGEDLQQAIADARGDRAAEARAIAEFISETGPRGMAWVRRTVDVSGRTEVVLHGDRFLRGGAAKRALEGRIARYRRQLSDDSVDRGALSRHIRGDLRGARARLAALQDEHRYEDLPRALRNDEIAWSQAQVDALESLREDVLHASPASTEAGASEEGSAEGEAPEADVQQGPQASEQRPETPTPLESERFTALQQAAEAARASAQRRLERLETSEDVHLRGSNRGTGTRTQRTPIAQLGEGAYYFVDGSETSNYAMAADMAANARATLQTAEDCMRRAEEARDESHFATGDRRRFLAQQLTLQLRTAASTFDRAAQQLTSVDIVYRQIAARHRDLEDVWGDYR